MDSSQTFPDHPRAWFRRPWGMLLIAVVLLVLVAVGIFLFLTGSYYRDIRDGTFDYAAYASEFTSAKAKAASSIAKKVNVSVDDDPSLGNPKAKLTIVAFEDFECPFSGQSFPIIRELMANHGEEVRFVYRDFPVTDLHSHAMQASLASECADDQGLFWQYHDKLYTNQADLSDRALVAYAKQVGMDVSEFSSCLTSQKHLAEVENDIAAGVSAGVRGTPTWFVNGQKIEGVLPLVVWEALLRKLDS